MDPTTLGGILTVTLGCYLFLHLAGKQKEVEKTSQRMARLRRRPMADKASQQNGSAGATEPDPDSVPVVGLDADTST